VFRWVFVLVSAAQSHADGKHARNPRHFSRGVRKAPIGRALRMKLCRLCECRPRSVVLDHRMALRFAIAGHPPVMTRSGMNLPAAVAIRPEETRDSDQIQNRFM